MDKISVQKWENRHSEKKGPVYQATLHKEPEETELCFIMTEEAFLGISAGTGDRITVCFYTDRGTYMTDCVIKECFLENGHYQVTAQLRSEWKKFQGRRYFRVDCREEFWYSQDAVEENNWKKAVLTDISGGGLRFITEEPCMQSILLQLRLGLIRNRELNLYAKLLNSRPLEKRQGIYMNQAQFVRMEYEDREELVRFVFERERTRKRKELG